jgi:hypothetical protein
MLDALIIKKFDDFKLCGSTLYGSACDDSTFNVSRLVVSTLNVSMLTFSTLNVSTFNFSMLNFSTLVESAL